MTVIHSSARGADHLAGWIATSLGCVVEVRTSAKPDLVLATAMARSKPTGVIAIQRSSLSLNPSAACPAPRGPSS
jgi:hypothetical protein